MGELLTDFVSIVIAVAFVVSAVFLVYFAIKLLRM